jgi:ornithine cyclodeaminase/alanine dehydrogenase-like protein (mu-crystallin family)
MGSIVTEMMSGSLLATQLALGPSASPRVLVVFGAGAQIGAHITLLLRYYSGSLKRCIIYNRSLNARVERLVKSLQHDFSSVAFFCRQTPEETDGVGDDVDSFRSDLGSSDVICTATPSTKALFPSSFVRPGVHLNLVGSYTPQMTEVETSLIHRAGLLMVDSRSACMLEAGELIAARVRPEDMREVGELVGEDSGAPPHDLSGGQVTIFKSVGLGVQDVAIAKLVVDLAERKGIGRNLDSYDDCNATAASLRR